jgi:hypothetical protein
MGSRQAGSFERELQSPSCHEGMHEECGHWRGYSTTLNRHRLRREGFAILCRCDCHSSCPVTSENDTVSDPTWRQSCTCPGAEAVRRMRDELKTHPVDISHFAETWAQSRHEFQSQREAFRAAQTSAVGADREQLKDLYVAQLRARGLKILDGQALDAAIDAHMDSDLTGVRLVGREVVNLGKRLGLIRDPR